MIRSRTITEEDIDGILQEAFIMSKFCHMNVLSIIGVVWKPGDPPLVVLPFMGKGSLLELVRASGTVRYRTLKKQLLNGGLMFISYCYFFPSDCQRMKN